MSFFIFFFFHLFTHHCFIFRMTLSTFMQSGFVNPQQRLRLRLRLHRWRHHHCRVRGRGRGHGCGAVPTLLLVAVNEVIFNV